MQQSTLKVMGQTHDGNGFNVIRMGCSQLTITFCLLIRGAVIVRCRWIGKVLFQQAMKKDKEAKKSGNKDGDKKQGKPPSVHAAAFCRPVFKVLRDPCCSDASF